MATKKKIDFGTAYDRPAGESQKGNKHVTEYKLCYCEETGRRYLEEDGYTDSHAEIQELAKGVGIENYIEVVNGEVQAVRQVREGVYGDFTNAPKTMHELHNATKMAKEYNDLKEIETKRISEMKKIETGKLNQIEKKVPTKIEEPKKGKEEEK